VPGPEGFQPERPGRQPAGYCEIRWDEQLVTHQPIVTAGLRFGFAPRRAV
jgi:hypothetical protein